jgi:FG-GAP-like repeat
MRWRWQSRPGGVQTQQRNLVYSSVRNGLDVCYGVRTTGRYPISGDYDGDGRANLAVFRPSNGTWYVLPSTGQMSVQAFGQSGDIPAPGVYDGDGKLDLAVVRPNNGTWYIVPSTTGQMVSYQYGELGNVPAPGDYDGSGKTDIAVFRPTNGTWSITYPGGSQRSQTIGQAGDIQSEASRQIGSSSGASVLQFGADPTGNADSSQAFSSAFTTEAGAPVYVAPAIADSLNRSGRPTGKAMHPAQEPPLTPLGFDTIEAALPHT